MFPIYVKGNIAFLPANHTYREIPAAELDTIAVYVDPKFASAQLRLRPTNAPLFDHLASATRPRLLRSKQNKLSEIDRHFHALARLDETAHSSDLRRLSLLACILNLLSLDHSANARTVPQAIQIALDLLEHRMADPWTVEKLSQAVALSRSQLTRLFVKHVGIPPSRYLRRLRACQMATLLYQGNLNVTESARAVGWRTLSHASRAYRDEFDRSPSTIKSIGDDRHREESTSCAPKSDMRFSAHPRPGSSY